MICHQWRHQLMIHPLVLNLLEEWPSGCKFRDPPSKDNDIIVSGVRTPLRAGEGVLFFYF